MACVYSALGADVSVVELMDQLMPGTDKDLLRPFLKIVKPRYEAIMTSTKVTGMRPTVPGIEVSFEGKDAPELAFTIVFWLPLAGRRTGTGSVRTKLVSLSATAVSSRSTSRCALMSHISSLLVTLCLVPCSHTRHARSKSRGRSRSRGKELLPMLVPFRQLPIRILRLRGLV